MAVNRARNTIQRLFMGLIKAMSKEAFLECDRQYRNQGIYESPLNMIWNLGQPKLLVVALEKGSNLIQFLAFLKFHEQVSVKQYFRAHRQLEYLLVNGALQFNIKVFISS